MRLAGLAGLTSVEPREAARGFQGARDSFQALFPCPPRTLLRWTEGFDGVLRAAEQPDASASDVEAARVAAEGLDVSDLGRAWRSVTITDIRNATLDTTERLIAGLIVRLATREFNKKELGDGMAQDARFKQHRAS